MPKKLVRKNILVIYYGALGDVPSHMLETWLKEKPELSLMADIQIKILFRENTSGVGAVDWIELARYIYSHYEKFDGFVVLHGLDNILYTASAVSFLLQSLSKPIIFTSGSATPKIVRQSFFGSSREIGIKANLINAIVAATLNITEVALMFGNKLLRANCARKKADSDMNMFEAHERNKFQGFFLQ